MKMLKSRLQSICVALMVFGEAIASKEGRLEELNYRLEQERLLVRVRSRER